MATELPPIAIEITAKVESLKAELSKVESQLKQLGTTTEKATKPMNGMRDGLKGVAGAMAGIIAAGAVVNILKESAAAASADAKSHELLANQLRQSVGASDAMITSVEKNIKAMETATAVADDDIRPAFAALTRATGNVNEATGLTALALDVAAGTGRDLGSVSLALAKAHDGNTMALSRLGISVKGVSDPMEMLRKQFGGAAETAANNDPYMRMKIALDNIHESIGIALMPVLVKFAAWLTSVVPLVENFFANLTNPATQAGAVFKVLSDALGKVFEWLGKNIGIIAAFGGVLVGIIGTLKLVAAAQGLFNIALAANPIGAVTLAVVGLTAALAGLYTLFKTNAGVEQAGINKAAAAAGEKAKAAALKDPKNWEQTNTGPKLKAGAAMAVEKAYTDAYQAYIKAHPLKAKEAAKTPTTQDFETLFKKYLQSAKLPGDTTAADKQKAAEQSLFKSLDNIRQNVLNAQKKFNTDLAKLQEDYAKKIADIQKTYQAKLLDVVNQSKNLLRDAFAQATSIDVGAMFAASFSTNSLSTAVTKQVKDGLTTVVSWWGSPQTGAGAGALLDALEKKLAASKQLSDNAGKLAGAGFSQTFIDQIVAQGTDLGNQMSAALLSAAPETQASLQKLFAEANTVSAHGVDELATKIYNTQGLATEALKTLYATTEADFVTALTDAESQFMSDSQALFDTLKGELEKANADLKTAIADAADAMGISVEDVTKKYANKIKPVTDAIQSVEDAATKALKNAQDAAKDLAKSAYAETMDAVAKQAAQTSTDLANAIAQLNAARAALGVSAPTTGPTAAAAATGLGDLDATERGGAGIGYLAGKTAAEIALVYGSRNTTSLQGLTNLGAAAGFTVNAPVTVQTNADPIQISTAIINGIKLNTPAILPAAIAGQMGAM